MADRLTDERLAELRRLRDLCVAIREEVPREPSSPWSAVAVEALHALPELVDEVERLRSRVEEAERLELDALRSRDRARAELAALQERLRVLERVARAARRATLTMAEAGFDSPSEYGQFVAQAYRDLRDALAALDGQGGGEG